MGIASFLHTPSSSPSHSPPLYLTQRSCLDAPQQQQRVVQPPALDQRPDLEALGEQRPCARDGGHAAHHVALHGHQLTQALRAAQQGGARTLWAGGNRRGGSYY